MMADDYGLLHPAAEMDASVGKPCQHKDCIAMGEPYWLPDSNHLEDEPDGYFCGEHAYDEGFCPGCGNFWAGNERFDFSPYRLCENCEIEVREGDEWESQEVDYWFEGSGPGDEYFFLEDEDEEGEEQVAK